MGNFVMSVCCYTKTLGLWVVNTVSRVATDLENLVKFREFERDLCKSRNLPKTVRD